MECDVRMDKEILELLQDMQNNINKRFDIIEAGQEELKASQKEITSRLDELSKGIGKLVSDEVGESISNNKKDIEEIKEGINKIKTEVEIIKLSVGEHEMDIKYLKKVK